MQGNLRAVEPRNFGAPPMAARWIAPDGGRIIGAASSEPKRAAETLRAHLAKDFCLVFADGRLAGWILDNPANYLVNEWELPRICAASPELRIATRDFLFLFSEPNIDAMQSDSTFALETFRRTYQTVLELPPDPRRDVLLKFMEEVREDWR